MANVEEEVVVVGAGVIGVAIGRALAREGYRVSILDAVGPGSGATSAALGSLTPYSDHCCAPATRMLARHSVELYPAWLQELYRESGVSIDYDTGGLLQLAFSPKEIESLRAAYDELREAGCRVEWLEQAKVLQLEAGINSDVAAALNLLDEPFLDVAQLFESCVASAKSYGCKILYPAKILEILVERGRVVGVRTENSRVTGDLVVLAAGTGCTELANGFFCPLSRVRGEVLEVRGPVRFLRHHLFCEPGFLTPRRDGRLLLGSTYDEHNPGDDEDRTTISAGNAFKILAATIRMVPRIADFQIGRMWKGWRPRSPDDQPILGRTPVEGLFVAGGLFGLGITLAPAVAELVANVVTGRVVDAPPEFRVTRFAG